ncbi:hypothetical protein GMW39_03750 [Pectobacterium parmentieri]|nr:hypothetical protein GMW39_03750 [Pectobacterium parmentieri]
MPNVNVQGHFCLALIRREKKTENYEAMLHFFCGIVVWNKRYWDRL